MKKAETRTITLMKAAMDEEMSAVLRTYLTELSIEIGKQKLPSKIEKILVVVAQRWGSDHPGSTVGIIGQQAIEVCEEYNIDWKNYK